MLDFNRFRILTFDCYGTLIDWESGIFAALRPILAAHKKTLSDSALLKLYSELEATSEGREFRPYRDQLRADLTRHNVEVKVQEDFRDLGGDTLDKLDVYIADCDAVVSSATCAALRQTRPSSARCSRR